MGFIDALLLECLDCTNGYKMDINSSIMLGMSSLPVGKDGLLRLSVTCFKASLYNGRALNDGIP